MTSPSAPVCATCQGDGQIGYDDQFGNPCGAPCPDCSQGAQGERLDDGFGNSWIKCGPDCQLEIVRPGKVQCGKCDRAVIEPSRADTGGVRVRRYRVSYQNGVIEEDGSPRSPMDSKPMVMASDYDALQRQCDELRDKLGERSAQLIAALNANVRHEAALERARELLTVFKNWYDGDPFTLPITMRGRIDAFLRDHEAKPREGV